MTVLTGVKLGKPTYISLRDKNGLAVYAEMGSIN